VIALEAARILPIRRLAVYEPPVRLAELLPLDWVPAFEAALAANDSARAMAIFLLGLRMGPAWMPTWLVHLGTRVLMRGERGREMAELLRTLPRDLATAREIPWGPSRYAAIGCPTLLLVGDRTPDYLKQAAASVAAAIPGVTRVDLPSLGHNGPDEEAPERVGAEILRFLRAGRAASAAHG
jgi:pimeloyl-ACP methyl ester carboxylesterase